MKTSTTVIVIIILAILVGGGYWLLTKQPASPNQNQQTPSTEASVKLSNTAGGGQILVDSRGMTLYYYAKDTLNKSNCTGQCVTAWPLFWAQNISVSAPLVAADFAELTRGDGGKQVTYKGWPLYYYFKDKAAGDTLGEGVGNVWYVVPQPFYNAMVLNKDPFGNYLVDAKGMTLYYFKSDTQGTATTTVKSSCFGQCLAIWPVFFVDNISLPSLMKNSDFGVGARDDGVKQLTYKGWPLYYYSKDVNSGDTTGDGFNNLWFVAKP